MTKFLEKIPHIWTIIIIGSLIYFNALFNGFVWDDEEQVINNALVHSITNLPSFFTGSTFNTGGANTLAGHYYKPMMPTFFSIIYSIFGPTAFAFHLFQLIFHLINSVLVYKLFKKFFSKNIAFISTLFFLVHPINTETVIYISALQDTIFFTFGLLALLLATQKILTTKKLFLISTLILLSLLSKETGILFLIITILYRYLFYSKDYLNTSIYLTSTFFLYLFLRLILAQVQISGSGPSPIMQATFLERLQTLPQIIYYYLVTTIFPKDLSIAQHWVVKNPSLANFYIPILFILLTIMLLFILLYQIKQKSTTNFCISIFFTLWLTIGIALHTNLFPLDMTVAERWFYFPFVGLIGILATYFYSHPIKASDNTRVNIILLILIPILSLLSLRTIIRNTNWQNGLTLYEHDSKISANAFDLENNYGVELFRAGQIQQAKVHFQRSVEIAPHWWTNWNNLGVIYEREQNYQTALEYYKKSIDNGQYFLAYENYANTLLFHKSPQSAKEFTQQSLKILPYNSKLWTVLALSEYKLGDKQKALQAAQNAYQLSPNQQTYYLFTKLQSDQPIEF